MLVEREQGGLFTVPAERIDERLQRSRCLAHSRRTLG
jgi:hypothetical protein